MKVELIRTVVRSAPLRAYVMSIVCVAGAAFGLDRAARLPGWQEALGAVAVVAWVTMCAWVDGELAARTGGSR